MKAVTGLMRLARRKPCRAFTAILLETKLWKIVSRKRQLSTLIFPRAYGYEGGRHGGGRAFRDFSSRLRIRNMSRAFRKRAVSVQPWVLFSRLFSRGTWLPRRQSALHTCFGGLPHNPAEGAWSPRRQNALRFQGTGKHSPLHCPILG